MQLDPKLRAFLTEVPRYGVLATSNPDGTIQQSVMEFDFEGDAILMNTKRGRVKDRNLSADPRLSLCFEDAQRYVAIRGNATLIDDQARAQADVYRLAVKYVGEQEAKESMVRQFSHEERITILVEIEKVTAYGL
jgi:PPOX class probable F420-dependent enzyme